MLPNVIGVVSLTCLLGADDCAPKTKGLVVEAEIDTSPESVGFVTLLPNIPEVADEEVVPKEIGS